ncbi:MAG: outer membrane protein assembly factor BamA [Candidatus Marithrix sp.]|nr:outer membrane protein assembly factor BamA [Candidatus Marithrix sp.]
MFFLKIRYITLILLFLHSTAFAFETFTVEDIRLDGLRRISAGTVFNYLPVKVGDQFSIRDTGYAISEVYKTGLFEDVRMERDGNILVVNMEERPAIYEIKFVGNEEIETENLTQALKRIGFARGLVFNRSTLEKVELELQRQYFNLSKYAVFIKSTVTPMPRNRVKIQVNIEEGIAAKIYQINLVGNHTIVDKKLFGVMELSTGGWFSFITKDNQYSSIQLAADLEAINSYYLDRGYLNFTIDSTQISITPDKKHVYITINLIEGDKYKISEVNLVGNLIVPKEKLMESMLLETGDLFSSKKISKSKAAISELIGDEGYYFASINAVPDIDEENKTVVVNFFIDPGKRIYVRRINFSGNTKTRDEVLRREMRQMETGWISSKEVKRSLTRLKRLRFFEEASVDVNRVPNTLDQVDIDYKVIERPSGNLMAGVGYSQTGGALFDISIAQENFLGSGKRVGLTFNNSQVYTLYRFSYLNPYTTINGISRGFNVFYRTTDSERANLTRYSTDVYGTGVNFGLPISEYNFFNVGGEFDDTTLKTTTYSADEIYDFIDENGDNYKSYRLTSNWRHDTRNRVLFPDSGVLQSVSVEAALPISDFNYYKVTYKHQWLHSLAEDYTLLLKGNIAYGDSYGEGEEGLPFFENYTAGGPHTVRGFRANTLGPLDSNYLPLGGNLKMVGNIEIILPVPFTENVRAFRISAFIDAGNVYAAGEDFDSSEVRYSAGLSAIWLSPVGVLSFSLAEPLNENKDDQIERFQFTLGTTFNW